MTKVVLTQSEWDALCDRTYDEVKEDYRCTALPVCCGNIGALRDQIIILRQRHGELLEDNKKRLLQTFAAVQGCHSPNEWDWTILNKLMAQVKT